MTEKKIIRRSITFPKILDDKLNVMMNEFNYTFKNDLIIEMIELGILNFYDNSDIKQSINNLISKIDLFMIDNE